MIDLHLSAIEQLRVKSPENFRYQQPVTPQLLIEEVTSHIVTDKTTSVLVLFTVEWALYLRNLGFTDIVVSADNDPIIAKACVVFGLKYQDISEIEKNKMKFDVVVGNPPYTKGIWLKFFKRMTDLSNKWVCSINPDPTANTSARAKDIRAFLLTAGIQFKKECTDSFPNVDTGTISYFICDQTRVANDLVFTNTSKYHQIKEKVCKFSNTSIIARAIVQVHKLPAGSLSTEQTRLTPVPIITSLTKTGPVFAFLSKKLPSFRNKYIEHFKERFFLVNRHFGKNKVDPVFEVVNGDDIVVGDNLIAISADDTDTLSGFSTLYQSKLYKFLIKVIANGQCIRDKGLMELPKLDLSKDWTDFEVYQYFKLTQDEIDLIESTVK